MQKNANTRNLDRKKSFLLIAAACLAVIDGITKYIVITQPSLISEGCLNSILCFYLHKNYGIAFNIPIPIWATLIISGAILIYLAKLITSFWNQKSQYLIPTSLIFIGALGNFMDRIMNGFTTDYLIFFRLSAINIADILIVAGVIQILWYSFYIGKERT